MVTFRNNNRRNNFRRNDRSFKSNGDRNKFNNFANSDNFQRKSPGRNNHNAPKLIDKYNDLAREALSNGDKILSENYLQHADHFTRILNERESFRRDKFLENNSETNSEVSDENTENSKNPHDKDLVNNSGDENKIQKEVKSQVEII